MLNEQIELDHVLKMLATWESEIRFHSYFDYTDINKASEGFARKLLNLIYDYELIDLGKIKKFHPGVDIGDSKKSLVAFQVTSRSDAAKILDDLNTVVKEGLDKQYPKGIKFFIIKHTDIKFTARNNPTNILETFSIDRDIITLKELSNEIKDIYDADYAKFLQLKELCEINLRKKRQNQIANLEVPEITALIDQLTKQFAVYGRSNVDTGSGMAELSLGLRLPSTDRLIERKSFLTELEEVMLRYPLLWLQGAVGTGKTSTASLLAKRKSAHVYWFDANEIPAKALPETFNRNFLSEFDLQPGDNWLDTLDLIIESLPSDSLIVINDIPDLIGKTRAQQWLKELFYAIASSESCLIVTSNQLPSATWNGLFSNKLFTRDIPPFSEDDILEALIMWNAPVDSIEHLPSLISFISEGHPLIVNAIIAYLSSKQWEVDATVLSDIFKNNYDSQLNAEIYNKLIDSTEDEQTRDLLFRLKLVNGTFDDDDISMISEILPVIDNPDQRISKLKGVWIQIGQNSLYQLSPLLKRLGQNLPAKLANQIYNKLAMSVIAKKKLNQYDFRNAIGYYVNGGFHADAAVLLFQAMNSLVKTPAYFYDFGFDLYWYTSALPDDIPLTVRIFIRFLHAHIALSQKKETAFLYHDIKQLGDEADSDFDIGLANLISYRINAEISPIEAITQWSSAMKFLKTVKTESQAIVDEKDHFGNGIWMTFYNLKPYQYIDWFRKIKQLNFNEELQSPETNSAYALAGATIFVNVVQGAISDKLPFVKQTLRDIVNCACEAHLYLIAAFALKNLVYAYTENEQDFKAATALILEYDHVLQQHRINKYLVIGEFGRQLFRACHNKEAFIQLSTIIDTNLPLFFPEPPELLRIYGKLLTEEDKLQGHSYLEKALERSLLNQFGEKLERVQLYGEYGISFWLNGNNEAAINCLEQGYDLLNGMFIETEPYQAAIIRYGHVANYIKQLMITGEAPTETPTGEYVKPYLGFFYGNDAALLAAGFYFVERRFVTALIFQEAYEYLGNYQKAKKWALNSIQSATVNPSMQFTIVMARSLFYLLEDGEISRVYSVYNCIIQDLGKRQQKPLKVFSENETATVQEWKEILRADDVIFYEYVMIPITHQLILDYITNRIKVNEMPNLIKSIFDDSSLHLNDLVTIALIRQLYEDVFLHNGKLESMIKIIGQYEGRYLEQIRVIVYLLYSAVGSATEAARYQLIILKREIEMFSKFNSGGCRYFLVPFYESFWLNKFESQQMLFKNKEFWYSKSRPYFQNSVWDDKLRRLFEVLVNHLDIKVSGDVQDWLIG
jgi:hypothetical protein